MKKILFSKKFFAAVIVIFFASSALLIGDENGRTGRTLKTSTSGCSCHGSINTGVTVTITGPDTVNTGQTQQYTLTVTNTGKVGMGLDIATRLGTLGVVGNTTHLSNGELTHNANIPMTNGTASVNFNYTAPGTGGTDTLWAAGLAGNGQNNSGGDAWNHAVSKRIIVRSTVGIEPTISPADYKISNAYPNPFNPSTNFAISLVKETNVSIIIYDIKGSEIYRLFNNKLSSGSHTFTWSGLTNSGNTAKSGIYFIKFNTGGIITTQKVILVK
ncbi:MAG: hemagluttinin repeat-containing protein [Chlorobi bacterium OLB5]|nr:MAG: hemagluttinin repeat-containing protein [Chlorobi bacterium OLB5]